MIIFCYTQYLRKHIHECCLGAEAEKRPIYAGRFSQMPRGTSGASAAAQLGETQR